MLYPYDPKHTCGTQPLVTITNVKLKNISVKNSLLFPIVMRCNETNPCKNIIFDNVRASGWLLGKKDKGYVCEHVEGYQSNSYPKLDCLKGDISHLQNQKSDDSELNPSVMTEMMLKKLEEAARDVPYIEEDDQMFLSEEQIAEDS